MIIIMKKTVTPTRAEMEAYLAERRERERRAQPDPALSLELAGLHAQTVGFLTSNPSLQDLTCYVARLCECLDDLRQRASTAEAAVVEVLA